MAEKSLTDVFGAGATQTATTLNILKADLVGTGLTASANNKAEQLFAAIVEKAADALNETSRDADFDVSIVVDLDNTPSFTTRTIGNTTKTFIRDTVTVELDKEYTSTGINPNDY